MRILGLGLQCWTALVAPIHNQLFIVFKHKKGPLNISSTWLEENILLVASQVKYLEYFPTEDMNDVEYIKLIPVHL